jgi:hypothetical protein
MSPVLENILGERLPEVFRELLDLRLHPVGDCDPSFDYCYELELEQERRPVYVVVKAGEIQQVAEQWGQRLPELRQSHSNALVLLAAPSLSESARQRLRKAGINYIDLEGHVYIWESGFRIWLEQPAVRRSPKPVRRGGRRPNPFSKRASFVLRALMEAPERRWGVRELSSETGLSVGYTSDVLSELAERGYAAGGNEGFSLQDPVRALFDWTSAYRWDRNGIHSFTVAYEPEELQDALRRELADSGIEYALTLLSGADQVARHVQHSQTHLYVRPADLEPALERVGEKLYGEPAVSGGNLHVLDPYYARAAFYGVREAGGAPVVSNVQLFLDLVHYPVRGTEAATMLLRTVLGRQLRMSREQIRTLVALIGGDG